MIWEALPASISTEAIFILALIVVSLNLVTWISFGWDKRSARVDGQRTPEKRLLFMAAIGGSVGAKAGQLFFRHKTRKQPFARVLNVILIVHGLALMFMLSQPLRRAFNGDIP